MTIKAPGKFEGEADYAPHFYEVSLEGGGVWNDENEVYVIDVSDEDRAQYPELGDKKQVAFYESNDGFWIEVEVP